MGPGRWRRICAPPRCSGSRGASEVSLSAGHSDYCPELDVSRRISSLNLEPAGLESPLLGLGSSTRKRIDSGGIAGSLIRRLEFDTLEGF